MIEQENLLRRPLMVDHAEADRFIVSRLIELRNACSERKDFDYVTGFDKVIRFFLTEDEFQKYVIEGEELQ